MHIGGRTIKTGLAITLALWICHLLNIGPAIFAAITAMVNLQPSVYQSYKNAIEQVGVTMIGIIIGLALAVTLGNAPLVVGMASILVILIALKLKWHGAIQIGIVTTIFILDAPGASFFEHAVTRISLIGVGLAVALVINTTVAPPKFLETVYSKMSQFHHETTDFFKQEIIDFIERREVDSERAAWLERLLAEAQEINQSIEILKREVPAREQETRKQVEYLAELYLLNSHLLNKIGLLQDIMPKRLARRAKRGDPPYTSHFEQIVEILIEANNHISHNAQLLEEAIITKKSGGKFQEFQKDEELDFILDQWQEAHSGDSYYLHALMEVSMVIYELRFVESQQRRLYKKLRFKDGELRKIKN